tara:strand:+ start:20 stop:892 length:873 start_codon:yes stop_codon:yes gene_type:complete
VADPVDRFMNQIANIEQDLLDDLKKIAKGLDKLSDAELVNVARELDFFQELLDRGYTNAVNGLMDAYEGQIEEIAKEAAKRGIVTVKGPTIDQIQILQNLEAESLLGKATQYANELKDGLFKGIVAGERPSEIVGRLVETVNLETHQLNVSVHDGFRQFDDLSRHKVFEGEDVRWTYVGPADELTRDACFNTLINEPANGYTEAEVNRSVTPFGTRGGHNCRHSWMVWESPNKVDEPLKGAKLPKKFKKMNIGDLNKGQRDKYTRLAKLRSARKITNQQWSEGLNRIVSQ